MSNFKSLVEASEAFDALTMRMAAVEATPDVGPDVVALLERVDALEQALKGVHTHMSNLDDGFEQVVLKMERSATMPTVEVDDGTFKPSWMYGPAGASELVRTAVRAKKLAGEGWTDSPDKVEGGKAPAIEA